MTIQHQQIGRNWPKTSENTILSPHSMYFDPIRAKTAKTRFFPELSLGYFINRPRIKIKICKTKKILRPDLEKLTETLIFGQKWPFWPKWRPNRIFRAKSENVTSVGLGSPNFVPKIKNFLWTDFEISAGHTNARTNRS